jgi:hypothetical protein
MVNLKSDALHTTDSKMRQQAGISKLKIYDLSDPLFAMRELAEDELKNIVGGKAPSPCPCSPASKFSPCPCDECSPDPKEP